MTKIKTYFITATADGSAVVAEYAGSAQGGNPASVRLPCKPSDFDTWPLVREQAYPDTTVTVREAPRDGFDGWKLTWTKSPLYGVVVSYGC
jgi:hypothetical protein